MKLLLHRIRERSGPWRRGGTIVLVVALALSGLWLFLKPSGSWRYYTDGVAIRRAADDAPIRYVLWEDPEPVSGDFNQAADTYEPCISADGRTMIFTRGRVRDNADLFTCEWQGSGWGEPTPITGINTDRDELGPAMSRDGRHLYFYSDRPGGKGGYDIWVAYWDGMSWGSPTNAGAEINSPFNEYGPALSPGGDRLFFSSNRPLRELTDEEQRAWKATLREIVLQNDYDVFSVPILPDAQTNTTALPPLPTFGETARVTELNSDRDEGQVVITPRGDFLYFSSNREGGRGGFDIYRTRLIHGQILRPENLGTPINTPFNEMDPALRLEGFGLVFSSNRDQADPLDYRLYTTASRDVFVRYDLSRWRLLWWSLSRVKWWLLILLAALALLMYLIRNFTDAEQRRQRSLLHTCLLASALIHALLFFLLGFWIISAEVMKTLSEPAMELAIDLDALARERISLDIREEVTKLPQSSDVLIVEQVERRLPIPELSPPEASPQPIIAQAALERFAFDVPQKPQPVPREVAAMETPEVMNRLPELELRPAVPRMLEPSPPEPEQEAKRPTLESPAERIARAEPELPQPEAVSTPPPTPSAPVERESFVPPTDVAPAPMRQPDALARLSEQLARLPDTDTQRADVRMDEAAKAEAEDQAKIALATPPAMAVAAYQAPPVPKGPVAAKVNAPETVTEDAMVSAVTASEIVEADTSSTLLPAEHPYTNLSAIQLAVRLSMERPHPESMAEDTAQIRLLARPDETIPLAETPEQGRPEKVAVQPLPPTLPRLAPAVEDVVQGAEAETLPEDLARPVQVATNLPDITFVAALPLETVRPQAGPVQANEARLAADSRRVERQDTPAGPDQPGAIRIEASAEPVPMRPAEIPDAQGSAEAAASRGDMAQPDVLAKELPEINVAPRVRLERAQPALSADPGEEPRLAGDRQRTPQPKVGPAPDTPRLAHVRAMTTPIPRTSQDVEVPAPADRILPTPPLRGIGDRATRQLPSLDSAATLHLETHELASVPHYLLRRPDSRGRILSALGGDEESEATVKLALDWFTRNQEPDGHWEMARHGGEAEHEVASTGLALLCYLGWGAKHTEPGRYQVATLNALDWLQKTIKPDGDLRSKDMYDQGIATMALTEAYGMTKDGRLREPAQSAVNFIVKAQNKSTGGWRYIPGDPGDTSVFGWQVMALKSAQMAGLDVPAEALDKADEWLNKIGGGKHKGLYGYQGPSPAPSMVAEGMFCRQLLGHGPDQPMMQETAAYLNTRLPGVIDFYYLYYGTLALFQHQGPVWEAWNKALRQVLMTSQEKGGENGGSWSPQGQHGNRMGRVVSTAMATLSLEVYYRYLPLYGLKRSGLPNP